MTRPSIFQVLVILSLGCLLKEVASTNVAIIKGNFVMDLYGNNSTLFTNYKTFWLVNGVSQTGTWQCTEYFVWAAMGNYIARSYSPFSSHDVVSFSLVIFLIDEWPSGSTVQIKIDNQIKLSISPNIHLSTIGENFCYGSGRDLNVTIIGRFQHSRSALDFAVSSSPLTSGHWIGLRQFQMLFTKATVPGQSYGACILPKGSAVPGSQGICHCSSGMYLDSYGICQNCHSKCSQCFGPTQNDCLSCSNGDSCLPVNECLSNNTYLLWNNTCSTSCDAPLIQANDGVAKLCNFPCRIEYGEYLHHNGSCISSCPYPFRVKDAVYCLSPCYYNQTYLLWDNTCSPSCDFPLVTKTQNDSKFCDSPCSKESGDYLYWNGSCDTSCSYYPQTTNGYKRCHACQPGYFLYFNNSCLPSCPSPFKQRTQGGSYFCDSPCPKEAKLFLEKEQTCVSSCLYPNQIQNDIFCVFDISEEQAAQVKELVNMLSTAGTATRSIGTSVGLLNFNNPAAILVASFTDMLNLIRYLDINFPPKLLSSFEYTIESPLKALPDIPEIISSHLPQQDVPQVFQKYDLNSSFLISFWESLLVLMVLGLIIMLFIMIKYLTKTFKTIQSFCVKILEILKWNFTLTIFTSYFGPIILYSSLEFRTANPSTIFTIISFSICFLINILALFVFMFMMNVVWMRWKIIKKNTTHKISDDKLQNEQCLTEFEVIVEGCKSRSFLQQSFMCIFVGRICLFVLIIAYLFAYPFVQAILMTILSASMFLYLIIVRPLQSWIDFLQYTLQELVMLVAKGSVFYLAVLDFRREEEIETREKLGDIVLYSSVAFSGISSVYLLIQIILIIKRLFKVIVQSVKAKKVMRKITPYKNRKDLKTNSDTTDQTLKIRKPHQPLNKTSSGFQSEDYETSFQMSEIESSMSTYSEGKENYIGKDQQAT